MEIKASQVKELRDMTGVAMMDCKKALVDCEGDIEKALDLLRSNSALKAEKKSSRVAADGILVSIKTNDYATILEINSETDFAAKDSNFLDFAEKVKQYISNNKITEISSFNESSTSISQSNSFASGAWLIDDPEKLGHATLKFTSVGSSNNVD